LEDEEGRNATNVGQQLPFIPIHDPVRKKKRLVGDNIQGGDQQIRTAEGLKGRSITAPKGGKEAFKEGRGGSQRSAGKAPIATGPRGDGT